MLKWRRRRLQQQRRQQQQHPNLSPNKRDPSSGVRKPAAHVPQLSPAMSDSSAGPAPSAADRSADALEPSPQSSQQQEIAAQSAAGHKRERDDDARQSPTPQRVKVEEEAVPAAEASPPPPPPPTGWRQAFIEKCVKTHYEQIAFVGKGRYGEVTLARDKTTGEEVALKRVMLKHETEGFPITAIREIQLLRKLSHKNIVKLKAVASNQPVGDSADVSSEIYFVLEYVEHDLAGILSASQHFAETKLSLGNIKHYAGQLLAGIRYCHAHNVLHRDIKASNLLISKTGELKIADFGLARMVTDKRKDLTPTVITLWYRPPEILLGLKKYDSKADMWSVGCVLAELLNGRPLFPASSEAEMLKSIWNFCGYPTEKTWPAFKSLLATGPHRAVFANFKPPTKDFRASWRELRPDATELELELLSGLLHLDPLQRFTADTALNHKWFKEAPWPDHVNLPHLKQASHEHQIKELRRQMDAEKQKVRLQARAAAAAGGGAVKTEQ